MAGFGSHLLKLGFCGLRRAAARLAHSRAGVLHCQSLTDRPVFYWCTLGNERAGGISVQRSRDVAGLARGLPPRHPRADGLGSEVGAIPWQCARSACRDV